MSKIIITGSEGFIGRNLKKKYKSATTVDFAEGADYKPFDFLNKFNSIVSENDVILHNGACSSTTENNPFYLTKVNFDYSQCLLKKCLEYNVRLIYASSASVYGDGPFIENAIKKPKNLYALSKSMFDDYAGQFLNKKNQITGLRYFNVYGPGEEDKNDMASVMYKFYNQAKSDREIKLFKGSGKFLRDFIYIDDVLDVIDFFIKNNISGVYNVGTGVARSFFEIAKIYEDKINCKIKKIEMPAHLIGKYQKFTCANNESILKIYSKNFHSLEQGIEKYLKYLNEK